MAFAGIFQPFARLRWIRFGLLMRDHKFSRRFFVPQTTALAIPFLSQPRRVLRSCSSRRTIGQQALSVVDPFDHFVAAYVRWKTNAIRDSRIASIHACSVIVGNATPNLAKAAWDSAPNR